MPAITIFNEVQRSNDAIQIVFSGIGRLRVTTSDSEVTTKVTKGDYVVVSAKSCSMQCFQSLGDCGVTTRVTNGDETFVTRPKLLYTRVSAIR
jgi:hypothetical protein